MANGARRHERASEQGSAAPRRTKPALMLAEFETAHDCLHAAEKLRDAGYMNCDAHTPFPIHGMDRAMGLADSKLGWIVLAFGAHRDVRSRG